MNRRWILGTRGSPLARWQSDHVTERLRALHPGVEIEIRIIATEGDLQKTGAFGAGDRGVFVRRIEEQLHAGAIDFAVHSLKDLPTVQPDGLSIVAVPERHDPRDALLSVDGLELDTLPAGSRIGTGSPRRRTQFLHRRPDLRTELVRGNVDTRIRKLQEGQFDALALAVAGVERLGIDTVAVRPIETEICIPAGGQGALALEARADDSETAKLLSVLEDPPSRAEVDAERAFLRRLGGGCLAPVGVLGRSSGSRLRLRGAVGDSDGGELLRDGESGPAENACRIGETLAERFLAAGAERILEAAREAEGGDDATG